MVTEGPPRARPPQVLRFRPCVSPKGLCWAPSWAGPGLAGTGCGYHLLMFIHRLWIVASRASLLSLSLFPRDRGETCGHGHVADGCSWPRREGPAGRARSRSVSSEQRPSEAVLTACSPRPWVCPPGGRGPGSSTRRCGTTGSVESGTVHTISAGKWASLTQRGGQGDQLPRPLPIKGTTPFRTSPSPTNALCSFRSPSPQPGARPGSVGYSVIPIEQGCSSIPGQGTCKTQPINASNKWISKSISLPASSLSKNSTKKTEDPAGTRPSPAAGLSAEKHVGPALPWLAEQLCLCVAVPRRHACSWFTCAPP